MNIGTFAPGEPGPGPEPGSSGHAARGPASLDLNDVVRGMHGTLAQGLPARVDLVLSLLPGVGLVEIDRAQLQEVLVHLLENAADAIPDQGRVTVETRFVTLVTPVSQRGTTLKCGRYAVLAVSDTGTGMTPDTWKRLFHPLVTDNAQDIATGFGLFTCDAIVRGAGGLIFADSELGAGSVFTVLLPSDDGLTVHPVSAGLGGHETILVLEDSASVRTVVRRVLEGLGYRVFEAATADEALAVVGAHAADLDLVVSDVVLRHISGADVVRQIQAQVPRVRSIFMSGHATETLARANRIPAGAAFIQKPFERLAFARKLREVLDA